jgi:Protein of unknown function (DUF2637)
MSPPVNGNRPVPSRRGLRLATLIATGVCVLAIAAGAFAFSYPSVRNTALMAGVSPHLARFYPLLFDAVLIVACAAAVTLRGVLRGYAWLTVLVIIGAIATADTVHALSITVPKRPLEATIAIAPWVVLLVGLSLLDAMIRRAPGRRTAAASPIPANVRAPEDRPPDSTPEQPAGGVVVPLSMLLHDSRAAPASRAQAAAGQPAARASRARAATGQPAVGASQARVTASQARVTASEPAARGGPPETTASAPETTAGPLRTTADVAADGPVRPAVAGSPTPVPQTPPPEPDAPGDAHAGSADPVTQFDRMRSTPTPPEG